MQANYLIGISALLYGLLAAYWIYTAFQRPVARHTQVRRLVKACMFGCMAVLLGWATLSC